MKRAILLIVVGAVIGGASVWLVKRGGHAPTAEEPAEAEAHKTAMTHDANGNVVINMSAETQKTAGIVAAGLIPARLAPELKGYGRVADPGPLAALMTELATARAAFTGSSNELARLKILEGQGNTSARALQTAEGAAQRDQLAVQSVQDRLALSWGRSIAAKDDLPGFIQSLISQQAVLVRIDLPPGDVLASEPTGARVVSLSGKSIEAEFLGVALAVDPQAQGRGFFFLIPTNALPLLAGESVIGYLKIPGESTSGVIVPPQAVIRAEGKGWVYVVNTNGESFTRMEINLDHPADAGWYVTHGLAATDHVVITGAQTLRSEELKSSLGAD